MEDISFPLLIFNKLFAPQFFVCQFCSKRLAMSDPELAEGE